MRKVLEALSIADRERYEQHYQGVKSFLKVKGEESDLERPDRVKRAFKPHEVTRLLDVWRDDRSIRGLRNNAMIRMLVYTGLRRSELVALRWSDVDIEAGVVTVRQRRQGTCGGDSRKHRRQAGPGAPAGISAGKIPVTIASTTRIAGPSGWQMRPLQMRWWRLSSRIQLQRLVWVNWPRLIFEER